MEWWSITFSVTSARRTSQWEKSAEVPRAVSEKHTLSLFGSIRHGTDGLGEMKFYAGDSEVPIPRVAQLDLVASEESVGLKGVVMYLMDEDEIENSSLWFRLIMPERQLLEVGEQIRVGPANSIEVYLAFSLASSIMDEVLRFNERGVAVENLEFECFRISANLVQSNGAPSET